MENTQKIKSALARALSIDETQIPDHATMGQFSGWDSIGHLTVMSQLGSEFGKEVPFDKITELIDIESLEKFFF
jgi:acyl carrier protein